MANVAVVCGSRIKTFDTLDQSNFRKDLLRYIDSLPDDADVILVLREEIMSRVDALLFDREPSAEGGKGPYRGLTLVMI